jgi:hypothetical protein
MPFTKQISFVKWIEILIYCVVLHPKPNTWVVSLSIIFVKMFFLPHYQTKFSMNWSGIFLILLLYIYDQTLGL